MGSWCFGEEKGGAEEGLKLCSLASCTHLIWAYLSRGGSACTAKPTLPPAYQTELYEPEIAHCPLPKCFFPI